MLTARPSNCGSSQQSNNIDQSSKKSKKRGSMAPMASKLKLRTDDLVFLSSVRYGASTWHVHSPPSLDRSTGLTVLLTVTPHAKQPPPRHKISRAIGQSRGQHGKRQEKGRLGHRGQQPQGPKEGAATAEEAAARPVGIVRFRRRSP